jgi:hypothetical protein
MPQSGLADAQRAWHAGINAPAPTERSHMSDAINRHDARALALIDHALSEGFTTELVAQIGEALASAGSEEGDHALSGR